MYPSIIWLICLIISMSCVHGNLPKKIHGGITVEIIEHPHQVSIQIQNYHLCGGVIISEEHILTTASCVSADVGVFYGNIIIMSATNNLDKKDPNNYWELHTVAFIITHEEYNPHFNWIHDIAILKLEKKMRFHIRQRSATWPPKYPQSRLFVTGWGTNSEMNVMKNYLQLVKVKSISSRICKVRYYTEGTLTGNQYCLFPRPPLARITWGNSGSPVTIGTGVVGLISVVSLDHKLPTTYSRVYNYMYWIQKNVEKLNSKLHY
ncbi:hypothetical protein HCN44_011334 [Aphidius gifuensis]|uniref:Peptidase S1 domain-containing protein n=1 Tax=Aphidius gifuensis TaxID=684658 RepID=A0A834XV87_APHGI|nr:hypothetical protein HCN44_011334 [Aphidius gifuensis]